MSNRSLVGAAMGVAALITLPAASEAHCLGYKHLRSDVVGVVDGTGAFVDRVANRMTTFGDRLLAGFHCDKHV